MEENFFTHPPIIRVVDRVGIPQSAVEGFRKRAYSELVILYEQLHHRQLMQGSRRVGIGDNAEVICCITSKIKIATVIIGGSKNVVKEIKKCWCCGPLLVAGTITKINEYVNDSSYIADIQICQKANIAAPSARIKTITNIVSTGVTLTDIQYQKTNSFASSETIFNVPFTDRNYHKQGTTVLVLVNPLYKFDPYSFNPGINRGDILNSREGLTISTDFTGSSGDACRIMSDKNIWDEEKGGDEVFMPFRILPFTIDSCLSGYKKS